MLKRFFKKPLPKTLDKRERFMREALIEAEKAKVLGETPVGCVITLDDKIIGRGHNLRETKKNALMHAELIAIENANRALNSWRLTDCDLYVTLEPCAMCAGAIINARIKNVFFGAYDPKSGACGSVTNLFSLPLNHRPRAFGNLLGDECSIILKDFFKEIRNKNRENRIN